jgi:hypothetical protein
MFFLYKNNFFLFLKSIYQKLLKYKINIFQVKYIFKTYLNKITALGIV